MTITAVHSPGKPAEAEAPELEGLVCPPALVAHRLTRPLAGRLLGFRTLPERVTDQIVQARLRSTAVEGQSDA